MKTKKIMLLYISICFFVLSLLSVSFAYYQKSQSTDITLETGEINLSISFYLDDMVIDETSIYYDQATKSYTFDITDEEVLNHISKVKVMVHVDTDIALKMRFKLLQSYVVTRTYHITEGETIPPYTRIIQIPNHSDTYYPYSLFKKGWANTLILGDDGYLYVKDTLLKGDYVIPLIEGGLTYYGQSHQTFEETGYVSFNLIVEVVQSNRYEAIWGINASFYNS